MFDAYFICFILNKNTFSVRKIEEERIIGDDLSIMMIVISGFQNAIKRETKDNLDTKIKCNQEEYKNHSLLYSKQLL